MGKLFEHVRPAKCSSLKASRYAFKAMTMGPPWVIYDDWTEDLKVLYVVSGLRETFPTAWMEHLRWSSEPLAIKDAQPLAIADSSEASRRS